MTPVDKREQRKIITTFAAEDKPPATIAKKRGRPKKHAVIVDPTSEE